MNSGRLISRFFYEMSVFAPIRLDGDQKQAANGSYFISSVSFGVMASAQIS